MKLRGSALSVIVGCLLASAVAAQDEDAGRLAILDREGREVGRYDGSYALLIGVSDYTAGWPDLPNVAQELAEVRKELRTHGFEIVEIPYDATAKEFKKSFHAFFRRYGYNSRNRLLVYFSGHGYSFEGDKRGYLVLSDAPDPLADRAKFLNKTLPMSRIMAWSRQIKASHVLFLFDSCFSAAVFGAGEVSDPRPVADATARPVRQYISAGRAGEQMPEKSVLAPRFARALRGYADLNGDDYVTGTELGRYLQQATASSQGQTLQYAKIRDPDLREGDFVFRLPEIKPRYDRIAHGTPEEPFIGPVPPGPAATRLLAVKALYPRAGWSVRIVGDGGLAYSTFRLENPLRFVVDFPGVVNKAGSSADPATGVIEQIRMGQFKPSPDPVARVVFVMRRWREPKIKRIKNGVVVRFPPRATSQKP